MKDYCLNCEYRDDCELADAVNFCENCRGYPHCGICYVDCKGGYAVECNNGFESKNDYGDDEYD